MHPSEDLPRLLTGDATRQEVLAASEHLRGCPDCRQELVSAVVAHAALTSAQRFAPDVVTYRPADADHEPASSLPDLSAVFAQVRAEASGRTRRPARTRWLAAAAAIAVLAGGGITIAETVGPGPSEPPSASISLRAFGAGTHDARATVVGERTKIMRIDATSLPTLDADHFYEVWLTDPSRTRMWGLGAIGSDNKAELPVTPSLLSRYADVEVSVQTANQTKYSGTSVLRGSYG
jgi:Anti-sigma-K factor rskA